MKILLDMNLSPDWAGVLTEGGWETIHWSGVGDIQAPDRVIMQWARDNGYVIFTHDLDFGILLATTKARGPSVIQIRTQDVLPKALGAMMIRLLRQYQEALEAGALITVDEDKSRVRILPF